MGNQRKKIKFTLAQGIWSDPLRNLLFGKMGSFTLFLQKNMTINKSVLTGKTDYGIEMV